MADATQRRSDPSPCPVRYCPVEHGDVLFPDLLVAMLDDDGFDPWTHVALVRRHLCRAVAAANVACDPTTCRAALAEGVKLGPGGTVNACKRTWKAYHDRAFATNMTQATGAFDDVLDDLGLGLGRQ